MLYELQGEKKIDVPIPIVRAEIRKALLLNEVVIKKDGNTSISFYINPFSCSSLKVFAAISFGEIDLIEEKNGTIIKYAFSFWILRIIASVATIIDILLFKLGKSSLFFFIMILIAFWGAGYLLNLLLAADRIDSFFNRILLKLSNNRRQANGALK